MKANVLDQLIKLASGQNMAANTAERVVDIAESVAEVQKLLILKKAEKMSKEWGNSLNAPYFARLDASSVTF